MNIKTIKLDINKRLYEKIKAKQGDTKSRFLLFHLLDGASPFSLVNRTVRVYGLKPDNKEIFNDLKIVDANRGHCELELTTQALAIKGDLELELAIYEGESKLTSIPFIVDVLKSINSTNAIESSNEYKALDRSLTKVEEWNNEFADKSGKLEQLYTERLNGIDSHLADIQNKLYKSIEDYRLPLETDYSEAFKRYFDDLKSGKKVTVKINVPICEIKKQIVMPYNVPISIVGEGSGNIIRYTGSINTDVFYCRKGDLGELENDNVYLYGEVKNIRFETSVSNTIMFKQLKGYISKFSFKDCVFSGFKYGIWFEKAWWTDIDGCEFLNGQNGVMLFDANSSRFINSYFRFLTGDGITYDSDLTYVKKGTAGITVAFANFEQVECGIRIKSSLYGGNITGCYWECNQDKPSIFMEDTASMSNFTFTGNFARKDNIAFLKNIRAVTFNGGHMALALPTTATSTVDTMTKSVRSLILNNTDSDYYAITNRRIHEDEIYDLTFMKNQKAYQPITSNQPVTISKDEIRLTTGQEVQVASMKAQRTFRLINYYADNIYQATVRVYKGSMLVYSNKSDIGEGSIMNPLYKEDFLSSPTIFKVFIANEGSNEIVLRYLTLSIVGNCYKS